MQITGNSDSAFGCVLDTITRDGKSYLFNSFKNSSSASDKPYMIRKQKLFKYRIQFGLESAMVCHRRWWFYFFKTTKIET